MLCTNVGSFPLENFINKRLAGGVFTGHAVLITLRAHTGSEIFASSTVLQTSNTSAVIDHKISSGLFVVYPQLNALTLELLTYIYIFSFNGFMHLGPLNVLICKNI